MQIRQVSYSLVSLEYILKRHRNSASCACALLEYYILQTFGASRVVDTSGISRLDQQQLCNTSFVYA